MAQAEYSQAREKPHVQDPSTPVLNSIALAREWYGGYLLLLLALLFGWLVLNWLSTIAARVEGLSMAVTDLRKDLEEIKEEVKAVQGPRDESTSGQ
jgi:hypothetical protein